jgi:hypothetical protein
MLLLVLTNAFFDFSALQLNDDEILLNLSPTRSPMNSNNEQREATISSNHLNNNNNTFNSNNSARLCLSAEELGQNREVNKSQNQNSPGNYDVAIRNGKDVLATNNNVSRTPWYHELVGCLRPVFSLMGKEKPINQSGAEGKTPLLLLLYLLSYTHTYMYILM